MNDDHAVYDALLAQPADARLVLATVIATRGSVPRRAGSRMVVDVARRTIIGTIGGGCGEADVLSAAPEVVATGIARVLRVELTDPIDSWSPAMCGGVMEVLIEPLRGFAEPLRGRDAARQSGFAAEALRARTETK